MNACPARDKALEMVLLDDIRDQNARDWAYADARVEDRRPAGRLTVKSSQFLRPLQEFSGACPGCGETPYAKLITQLFGDRMMISNAAGCSTVWAAGAPSVSYTTDRNGTDRHGVSPCSRIAPSMASAWLWAWRNRGARWPRWYAMH